MHCAFRRPFYVAPPENGAIAFGRIKNIPMGTDVFASCCVVMLRVASCCFVMRRDAGVVVEVSLVLISSYLSSL